MIKSFKDERLKDFYGEGRIHKSIPHDIAKRVFQQLVALDSSCCIKDLLIPPSNHLERLKGDRVGFYSIRVNDKWRICFRWTGTDAYAVELVDYH